MSGNPFRRSQGSRLPDDIAQSNESSDTAPLPKTKTKKKKKVVIQTPPHSPEEPSIPRRLSDGRTGSPPPPVSQLDDDETDSTTTADSDLEQALLNTRRNSGSLPPPPTTFGVQSGSRGAPYNPFARTLATSEAAFGLQKEQERPRETEGANGTRPAAGRPALDVDAFKNILMTGSAAPSPPTNQQPAQRAQDSSSNTDTSSMSRQSIFDPAHEAHPESPRTSFDDHPHYDDDDDDDDGDDEHSSLMGPVASRPVEEGPPPPPKHKHGRAFPQTVSFADFDENIPSQSPARLQTPPIDTSVQGRPSTPRSPSDLNKPLPPPPANRGSVDANNEETTPTTSNTAPTVESLQAKRAPPPPPTSRRRGQVDAEPGRGRSTSNLSASSAQQVETTPAQQPSEQASKAAPPPPPSRRAAQHASNVPSPAVETPPSVPSPPATQADTKAMPPPPPRRHPSKAGNSAPRTPSSNSRTSIPRSDSFTATPAAGQNAPPAPPPRRGAQFKRNSMNGAPSALSTQHSSGNAENRRTSGHSFQSDRSTSLSSLRQVVEPSESEEAVSSATTEKPERDIIADMAAFQAEIDALRAQAARNG